MTKPAPVTVGIPTFGRGSRVVETLERLTKCDPPPVEVIVHVDRSNGEIERELAARFPTVRLLSSPENVGPGGGRHRCLLACTQPFFASFDDDSWPIDGDFFAQVTALFERHDRAALLAASIYFPGEVVQERASEMRIVSDYTGCGYAIRTDAYRQTAGHIDRSCPYGFEEVDLAMQLHALEWSIFQCRSLRVFHDTQLSHHAGAEVVAGTVQNVALRAYLRYPVLLWPRAVLQLCNVVWFMLKMKRFAGLGRGLRGIPTLLRQHSSRRQQLPAEKIRSYLKARSRFAS
jgi:GT2 family glycosyltransferase